MAIRVNPGKSAAKCLSATIRKRVDKMTSAASADMARFSSREKSEVISGEQPNTLLYIERLEKRTARRSRLRPPRRNRWWLCSPFLN